MRAHRVSRPVQRARELAAILVLAVACGEPAGPPPEVQLAATRDTLVVPVTAITSAVPQSDGKWVLLAPEEGAVLVADFGTRALVPHPAAPKAAPGPSVLIGIGDTVVVGNWTSQQFSSWLPTGEQIGATAVPQQLAGAFPRARDAAGQ